VAAPWFFVYPFIRGPLRQAPVCPGLRPPFCVVRLNPPMTLPCFRSTPKRPFGGPKAVLVYLSRYTHRVAISNRRLIAIDEKGTVGCKASRGFVLRRVADAGWRWVWLRLSRPASATLHR
jgi:hypothetical protein